MAKILIIVLIFLLPIIGCATSQPKRDVLQPALKDSEGKILPSKSLILGVPFISWGEAAHLDSESKDSINPSVDASLGMVLTYWGQEVSLLKDTQAALPKGPGGWGISGTGNANGIDEIKPFIARGIPIVVSPAIVPAAHPMMPFWPAMAAAKGLKITQKGPSSGVLGRMEPLETFRKLERFFKMGTLWETLFSASRVVIGYDDDRKMLILHDPTFGPGWEVSYDEFERMWKYTNNWYLSMFPTDYADILAKRTPAQPYPPRTPDQQAATHYVFAYALSSVGQMALAKEEINKGLSIPGVRESYQHLLELELANIYLSQGKYEEAILSAQRAAKLVPEHFRSWQILATAYKAAPGKGNTEKAAEAEKRAYDLSECSSKEPEVTRRFEVAMLKRNDYLESQKIMAKILAQDFFIVSPCRGSTILWLLGPID